jgi:ribosomal-protein-alanine N-acetyltransferase
MIEILTERLTLRPLTTDDLEWISAFRGDADVMRYIGSTGPMTPDQSRERLDRYVACWAERGLGMFGVRELDQDAPIGWAGLQPLDGTEEIEVGYAFGKAAWGRGIATEAASAVMRWGFRSLALERIVAVAYPENDASRRVMQKLGMRHEAMRLVHGVESVYYSVTALDFEKHASSANMPLS